MITNISLQQDINNSKFYELVVTADSEIHIDYKCISTTSDGLQLWYGENPDGFVSYYAKGVAMYGHDENYQWSSRSGVFNALGKKCMDITLLNAKGWRMSSAMTVDKVAELLPDGYEIAIREEYCDGAEVAYCEKGGLLICTGSMKIPINSNNNLKRHNNDLLKTLLMKTLYLRSRASKNASTLLGRTMSTNVTICGITTPKTINEED